MKIILDEAKKEFDLFNNNKSAYQANIDYLNSLFNLKNDYILQKNFLPTFAVGNTQGEYKYLLFSLNPGFEIEYNTREEEWKNKSFKQYINFTNNFFQICKDKKEDINYFKKLSDLFSGLENRDFEDDDIFDFYHKHLINLQLIPYHSKSYSLSNSQIKKDLNYFKNRFSLNLNFLESIKSKVKLVIFNGKTFYNLIINNKLIDVNYEMLKLNEYVNMYIFTWNNLPCILFDKYITSNRFKLTSYFKTYIPEKIKSFYPHLK